MSALKWETHLTNFLEEFRQPVRMPGSATDLVLGNSDLRNDHEFMIQWLSFIAQKTEAFESYEAFLRRFRVAMNAPRRPLTEAPNPRRFRPHQRPQFVQALADYHLAFEQYRQRRDDYETLQRELDDFTNAYSADGSGYIRFVDDHSGGDLVPFLSKPQRLPILEMQRQRHTLLTGTTGSGKSELLKRTVHHYLTKNKETAIIVLDPHGSLGTQIAQFRENSQGDRLMLIDPALSDEHTPVLNPFEVDPGLSPRAMDVMAQQVTAQFEAVLGEGAPISANMRVMLSVAIATLIRKPEATIRDLMDFLSNEYNTELIDFGLQVLTNPEQRAFLERDFSNIRDDVRNAVKGRLQIMLQNEVFRNCLVGESTFDLEPAVNAKKLIIFNLSQGTLGEEVAPSLGRMVMSQVLGFALRRGILSERARERCIPVHVFIDEAHNYTVPTMRRILSEARKYGVALTLATQYLDQFTDREVRASIEQNSNIKISGLTHSEATRVQMGKLLGTTPEKIGSLAMGEYVVKIGASAPYSLKNDQHLLESLNAMPEDRWNEIVADQLGRYYRPLAGHGAETGSSDDAPAETALTQPGGLPLN